MKVRNKNNPSLTGTSCNFNTHAMSEILVYFDENGGADSAFISEYEVFIEKTGEWKDLHQAFKDNDIISDNYNTIFFEPKTKEDRDRGYTI